VHDKRRPAAGDHGPEATEVGLGIALLKESPQTTQDHTNTDPILREHANAIHVLAKRITADVIEIGRRLAECKDICGHGNWLPWLEREFEWSDKTAENFINVYKLGGKFENFSNLDLPISALYMLAAPSTPEAVVTKVITSAKAGETVPFAEIKKAIHESKATAKPDDRGDGGDRGHHDPDPEMDAIKAKRAKFTIVNGEKPAKGSSAEIEDTHPPLLKTWWATAPADQQQALNALFSVLTRKQVDTALTFQISRTDGPRAQMALSKLKQKVKDSSLPDEMPVPEPAR
jgi:hypothetical protein